MFTPAEAADVLSIPESWLRRQAGRRTIPSTMIGGHLRFTASELNVIVAAAHRPQIRARVDGASPH